MIAGIEFVFTHRKISGIVSNARLKDQTFYHVQIIDAGLAAILKTDHISYVGVNGYEKMEQFQCPAAKQILLSIAEAMNKTILKQYNAA